MNRQIFMILTISSVIFHCCVVFGFKNVQIVRKNVVAHLSTGKIRGIAVITNRNNSANVFLNVPYARNPSGTLRFRPPLPPQKWTGTRDCTRFGPACPQNTTLARNIAFPQSEDCLRLNIFAGINCSRKNPCPVVYYVFGGMWYFGMVNEYPVHKLVDNFASTGLVFVTVNYRLGALGMWGTGQSDAIKNLVFYDLLEGLRWTRREIINVGGDPNMVSIMGHSSGSMAVSALSLSPRSKNLYRRVIFMAGPPILIDCTDVNKELAVSLNCATNIQWEQGNSFGEISECMRNMPLNDLLRAQTKMFNEGKLCFGAQPDGPNGLFPSPLQELREQREPYEMLLGDTESEYGNLDVTSDSDMSDKGVIATCMVQGLSLGFKHSVRIAQQCPRFFDPLFTNRTKELKELRDSFFFVGMFLEADTMRKKGAPVYLYSFDYVRAGLEGQVPYHSYELAWVVGLNEFNMTKNDEKVGQYFASLFSNFAKYGNPTPWDNLPKFYPLASPVGYNYYAVNLPEPKNLPYFHLPVVQFWTGIAPALERILNSRQKYANLLSLSLKDEVDIGTGSKSTNWKTAFFIALAVALLLFVILIISLCVVGCKVYQRRKFINRFNLGPNFEKSTLLDPAEFSEEKSQKRRYYYK